jgi:putative transposase
VAGAAVTTGAVHHSGAGSQDTSVRFTETLTLAGLAGSSGTAGDAYDNTLAETTVGLCKSGPSRQGHPDGSPFRDGPLAAGGEDHQRWVHWYSNDRLMRRTGPRPPAETDERHWAGPRLAPGRRA